MKKPVGHYEILPSENGQYYFTLVASNGEVLLTSETMYVKRSILKAIRSTRWNAFWGKVVDKTN